MLLLSGSVATVAAGASGREYTRTRMYDTRTAFAPGVTTKFLRGLQRFISSITENAGSLLLSYGVNDCEAKVGRIPLAQVWSMLQPLDGVADSCV